jgi:polysaccharide export outer membrane protein
MKKMVGHAIFKIILSSFFIFSIVACSTRPSKQTEAKETQSFKSAEKKIEDPLLSKEELALIDESIDPVYLLGSGDRVWVDVYGRPTVSGKHVVGPDGIITLPLIGNVFLNGLSREEAQKVLDTRLREYFSSPYVNLGIEEYSSNQVTVLGRVERAGILRFAQPPTLIDVLASAGSMPVLDKQATLARCAIIRGREKLIWVDLKGLLNGEMAYNLRMKKGDIVFIPDSSETAVFVLGAVFKPGSYRLSPRMTLLDALAQAGGPNENAAPQKIGIYRPGTQKAEIFEYADLISPERKVNYSLENGDVIFVPNSKVADFGYFMRQVSPALSVLTFGVNLQLLNKATSN